MPNEPIDPLTSPRYVLEGKVVTMDDAFNVLERGTIYIDAGTIVAVQPTEMAAPPEFDGVPVIRTGGTIYPGLIELHNHLSYNILPLWNVPKPFDRREQWRSHPDKQKLITGPMKVLGKTPGYVEAIVRYVECKCLVAGVTTSQGLRLYGVGTQPYYRGVTRNVEDTDDPSLPEARTKISDVEATDANSFLQRLKSSTCLLLHLSEGIDDRSREHFEALQLPSGDWAITEALAGIHCAALTHNHFQIMKNHKGFMVWSPLSNFLLYGKTADIAAAKASDVLIGIGSDWSPSGSKNLLGELKVAHLVSENLGGVFTKREIVAMATRNAAKILKWDSAMGSIEQEKQADLLVVRGRKGDPYDRLINARETSISLVVVNGVPRCGQPRLMDNFGEGTEELLVGRARRILNLREEAANPVVGELTLKDASDRLKEGLQKLPELAADLEDPTNPIAALADMRTIFAQPDEALVELADRGLTMDAPALIGGISVDIREKPIVFLELDQDELVHESLRPHLPSLSTGELTGFPLQIEAAIKYSELLEEVEVELDPLTVMDDRQYANRLDVQPNLPPFIKNELPGMYGF
jgi:cytosine/adenosine deaminase-related metal-dependent hydrolase